MFDITREAKIDKAQAIVHHELSIVSYIILAVVLLVIVCGLGWCFYRALSAAAVDSVQHPDEVGDEQPQA